MELAIGVIAMLAALIPVVIEIWRGKRVQRENLQQHSLDELHIGTDSVRGTPPVRPN